MDVKNVVRDVKIAICTISMLKETKMAQIFTGQSQGSNIHYQSIEMENIRLKVEKC